MEGIREYLFSITAGALLCGVLQAMTDKEDPGAAILKLVCGIFLTITVLKPLGGWSLTEFAAIPEIVSREGEGAAAAGEEYARRARIRLIKAETEAYILDKAAGYDLALQVEVTVDEETLLPASVSLRGETSPYTRQQMIRIIEKDLGIREENVQWTR